MIGFCSFSFKLLIFKDLLCFSNIFIYSYGKVFVSVIIKDVSVNGL